MAAASKFAVADSSAISRIHKRSKKAPRHAKEDEEENIDVVSVDSDSESDAVEQSENEPMEQEEAVVVDDESSTDADDEDEEEDPHAQIFEHYYEDAIRKVIYADGRRVKERIIIERTSIMGEMTRFVVCPNGVGPNGEMVFNDFRKEQPVTDAVGLAEESDSDTESEGKLFIDE